MQTVLLSWKDSMLLKVCSNLYNTWEHDHQPSCMPLYEISITSVPRTIIVFQSSLQYFKLFLRSCFIPQGTQNSLKSDYLKLPVVESTMKEMNYATQSHWRANVAEHFED